MKVEQRSIDDIRPYEQDPRQNDAAVDAVLASLREFNWRTIPVMHSAVTLDDLTPCSSEPSDCCRRHRLASQRPVVDDPAASLFLPPSCHRDPQPRAVEVIAPPWFGGEHRADGCNLLKCPPLLPAGRWPLRLSRAWLCGSERFASPRLTSTVPGHPPGLACLLR